MVARTVVDSLSGAILSVSASLPNVYTQAGYEDTDYIASWTAVGEVENYGSHGVTAAKSEFTPVDTAVTAKVKGAKNYGALSLVLGHLPGDAGQVILKAASESNNRYSVKIAYDDGEIHYLDVLVLKFEYQDGAVNDIKKVAVDLEVCRQPVVVLP